ncbi:MAG: NTP transferase domain-containing protein [Lachnospira sp.]|nr:NTP transferase domain-containing protein [Lachnospira sp.]
MNIQKADILRVLSEHSGASQRELAQLADCAAGTVNKEIRSLQADGFIADHKITDKARDLLNATRPHNAIILAAGFGMRMVPINYESPKAFLEVHGEKLIERQIRQLNEVGIHEIHIVVGFMKERFDYLVDKYGVDLIVNPEYAIRNNLHSLFLARKYLKNSYIIPSDVWCAENPFRRYELYSWYMVSDRRGSSYVRVNRKKELVVCHDDGNAMVGISYLAGKTCEAVGKKLEEYNADPVHNNDFWEKTLSSNNRTILPARVVPALQVAEINTYEQLRDLDEKSEQLNSEAIATIIGVFHCEMKEVQDIQVLKKGMTNRSFLFAVGSDRYIMRIPGEGTDQLIDRKQETAVYQAIRNHGLCDDPVYINPQNGYKITKFLNGVRNCDPTEEDDLKRCMKLLRNFHDMKLKVGHTFDLFGQMELYQSLWQGTPSMYPDYKTTKANVLKLKKFIDCVGSEHCLTHIDAVADNFLFYPGKDGREHLQLTDWEYAGMQDPHVDIAMFCIYSLYDREQVDHLIDLYFEGECSDVKRCKIYCYISVCGLLWSNWCEYKAHLGVEFGEYSLRQYRYAKEYYKLAVNRMEKLK